MADTDSCQIFRVRFSELCVKQSGKMRGRVTGQQRDRLEGGIFLIVLLHVVNSINDGRRERRLVDHLTCILVRVVFDIVGKPVVEHDEQKVTENTLNPELSVRGVRLIQFMHFLKI